MSCTAGFRHEVMPLPFELQMLEVRTVRCWLARHLDMQVNVLCTTSTACSLLPAFHILAGLCCGAGAEDENVCTPDLTERNR